MASNNWPPLRVFAHSWPHLTGCTHSEIVDEWDQRLYAPHVWESGVRVITSQPTYDCPACAEPGRSHVNIMTRPRGGVPLASATVYVYPALWLFMMRSTDSAKTVQRQHQEEQQPDAIPAVSIPAPDLSSPTPQPQSRPPGLHSPR